MLNFRVLLLFLLSGFLIPAHAQTLNFNENWLFKVDTANIWNEEALHQKEWRNIDLPHDWSIELPFEQSSPSGARGAALRGGLGLYEKHFKLGPEDKDKKIFIRFDGIYMNSTVRINGHTLGTRPNGYSSFEYELTPFLKFDGSDNVISVRVENRQPNSRWYSGSGIYRNVWLKKKGSVYLKSGGIWITTPEVSSLNAKVNVETRIKSDVNEPFTLRTDIFDPSGNRIHIFTRECDPVNGEVTYNASFDIKNPQLWDINHPNLYKAVTQISVKGEITDNSETVFGIRNFHFDKEKGFFLNGNHVRIVGANMHHDLGALGAAVNIRAMERQLEILKEAGFNAVRTAHNPPAPEWLDLCDQMGFIVMNETFDVWQLVKENTTYNYNLYFDEWFEKDLEDHIKRDRNHPSVFIWSIGNEIPEQSAHGNFGGEISRKMVEIVKKWDHTRPVTAGMNFVNNHNQFYKEDALDIWGANYSRREWPKFGNEVFPGDKPFIITEAISPLATRGHYDMPSDSIQRWSGFTAKDPGGNPDFTVSSYEHRSVPWGSTNEEALKTFLKHPFLSGIFMWTGFDYLGEPTPYDFPARSSYFGVVDLAGFPKDSYYLYKSLFGNEDVLHVLPHWNWESGDTVDVHVYFSGADEVELYINEKFIENKSKEGDDLFVRFNGLEFQSGTLKAVSKKDGKTVLEKEVKTAGAPHRVILEPDRTRISADSRDLSYIKVSILDKEGNLVPYADALLEFEIEGPGSIAALDNGFQADLTPFSNKKNRKAWNGLALAIIRADKEAGEIKLKVSSENLKAAETVIISQ